jgi:putative phosphoribosyl transferase
MIATEMRPKPTDATGALSVHVGTGDSLPGVLAWPGHPSAVVLVLAAGRQDDGTQVADGLAAGLRRAGLATLVVDLTTGLGDEACVPMRLLVERTKAAALWLSRHPMARSLPVGMLGVDAAASAALTAAGVLDGIEAIVVWEGRPDEARDALARITVPTLLLLRVGDEGLLRCQQRAPTSLCGARQIIGVTGLAARDGGLAEAARWAAAWFVRHLVMERTWRRARLPGRRKVLSSAS